MSAANPSVGTAARRPSWKNPFFLVAFVAVAGGLSVLAWRQTRKPGITYREFKVERGNLASTILSTGTVQPENRLEIKPPIAGRVETVLVQEGQKVAKGQILAWMSSTERAGLIDAARSQGPDELKKWEELYKPTPIIAPIAGTLILRNVESGQTFTNADAILVMSDRLTVKAQVDETDIAQIKLRQSATIVLDAYAGQRIPARVDQIAFEAKTVNNVTTYVVDVLPVKTPDFMRSGMTANVVFDVEARENVLWIPSEAVKIDDGGATTTLVRGSDGKPTSREIKLGIAEGKRTEIVDGLQEGETILVARLAARDEKSKNANPFSPIGGGRPGGGNGRKR